MQRWLWIIQVGPEPNDNCPQGRRTDEKVVWRRGRDERDVHATKASQQPWEAEEAENSFPLEPSREAQPRGHLHLDWWPPEL